MTSATQRGADVIPSGRRGMSKGQGAGLPRRFAPRNDKVAFQDDWGAPRNARVAPREARVRPIAAAASLVSFVSAAFGQTQAQAQAAAQATQGPSLLPLILTLVFVLALIPVAVWMLKRMGAGSATGAAGLRVVAQLSLGQRERLVVVEAGERWLVLGVTPSSVNRVGTLPKGELPPAPDVAGSFASLLKQARKGSDRG